MINTYLYKLKKLLCQFTLIVCCIGFMTTLSTSTFAVPSPEKKAFWSPRSSERLIKLPSNYLKKAIDRDFENSSLGGALYKTRDSIKLKMDTLEDIRESINHTQGDLQVELRHQFLAEKRAYLELAKKNQKIQHQRAKTNLRIYKRLLSKMRRSKGPFTPQKAILLQKQRAAHNRFTASVANIDAQIFRSDLLEESKYAREYSKNANAIEKLVQTINTHPMNDQKKLGPDGMSKENYIRKLIMDSEADIAILEQKKTVLSYMAKIISLDALALAESLPVTGQAGDLILADRVDVADAVDFFMN